MDYLYLIYYVCFIIGLIFFIGGICFFVFNIRRRKAPTVSAISVIIEFLGVLVLNIPIELGGLFDSSIRSLYVAEGLSTALIRTINSLMGEGYVEPFFFFTDDTFCSLYIVVRIWTTIALLFFVATAVVISFFYTPIQYIRYLFLTGRDVVVFPCFNEKVYSIAKSIRKSDRKMPILFMIPSDIETAEINKIRECGGIYLQEALSKEVARLFNYMKTSRVFLFGEELDNLEILDRVFSNSLFRKRATKKRKKTKIQFYVELSGTHWRYYDDFVKRQLGENVNSIIVNFINPEENFAQNNLLKNSIFKNAIGEGKKDKDINILIIGNTDRCMEMVKNVLMLGQMPGFFLNVLQIVDGEGINRIKQEYPEYRINEIYDDAEDGRYSYSFVENIPYESCDIEKQVESRFSLFTFVFIDADTDFINLRLAQRINALAYRQGRIGAPTIQVSIKQNELAEKWNKNVLRGIKIVGGVSDVYNYTFITNSDIERASIAVHKIRRPETPWHKYCNDEYNRHSVYARTLSLKHKVQLIDEYYNSQYFLTRTFQWGVYEHLRWNMYTRSLGMRFIEPSYITNYLKDVPTDNKKTIRQLAGGHECLRRFSDLPPKEQEKDDVDLLNPDIVNALKEI